MAVYNRLVSPRGVTQNIAIGVLLVSYLRLFKRLKSRRKWSTEETFLFFARLKPVRGRLKMHGGSSPKKGLREKAFEIRLWALSD